LSNLGGIVILAIGGIIAYSIITKGNLFNNINNPVLPKNITPNIITELQKSIPNLSGSQVSNLIHGGTINTGYLGTNGKWYADYATAKANGAA